MRLSLKERAEIGTSLFAPKSKLMKLHRQLFWLLILLLPVQLGRHFWFEWTQVLGLPIDYLSPTVYLTDFLVVAVLFFWWWDIKRRLTIDDLRLVFQKYWWVGAVLFYLLITSLLAQNSGVALYKFVKIIEFVLLGFYVARNNYPPSALRLPLSLAVAYSSLIAIFQFVKQASLGGVFWWLGERNFNLITPGIAKAIISGRLILRPYATFPHPNVLAGFILVSLMLIVTSDTSQVTRKIIKWVALISGGIAIILSFSRAVWLVGLIVGFLALLKHFGGGGKRKYLRVGVVLLVLLIAIGVFFSFAKNLSGKEALSQRFSLAQIAIKMIKAHPLVGVGLNNFIPQLPNYWQQFGMTYWLQPVHNIYLLVATEIGLVGLLIFLWLLILTFKKLLVANRWPLIIALSVILVLGFFDHYWLTLQQSQLLLTIVLGLSWGVSGSRD